MSDCTHPDECKRARQALKLAHQAASTLGDGATQLRIAKFGCEAVLERLDELNRLPAMPDGSTHPRALQIMRTVHRAMHWMDNKLDAAYCETHALMFQLDKTIGQWELENLEPAQH